MKRIAVFLIPVALISGLSIAGCATADRPPVAYQNESRLAGDEESYLAPSDREISSADEPPSPVARAEDQGR